MGKLIAFGGLLFAGLAAYIYVFGAPESTGHGVDPDKAVDSAGKAADLAGDYARPWYDYISAQAWFGAAVVGLGGMLVVNRIWRGMNVTAKVGVSVVLTAILVLTLVGLST